MKNRPTRVKRSTKGPDGLPKSLPKKKKRSEKEHPGVKDGTKPVNEALLQKSLLENQDQLNSLTTMFKNAAKEGDSVGKNNLARGKLCLCLNNKCRLTNVLCTCY